MMLTVGDEVVKARHREVLVWAAVFQASAQTWIEEVFCGSSEGQVESEDRQISSI